MNITQENTSDLTATIKVEMTPEDYQAEVNKALKDLQRKANLPGFRPGKVPFGIVKKKYGDGVLAEEVNKVLGEGLNNFIKDNNLEILGHPLGNREKGKPVDFDNDEKYEFYFDLGLTPKIDIELSDKIEVDYYDILVEDDKVDMYLEDIRKRFGNSVDVDEVTDNDMLKGTLTQIDGEGKILENGWVFNDASLLVNYIKDEKVKKDFFGKKKNDKVNFNPLKATGNETETAAMLGIKKEEKEKLEADYELTISEISRVEPSEINEELFKKVYPKDDIKDEAEFREKLRDESKKYYQRESENYFVHNTIEELLSKANIQLPNDFMKRWLLESDNKVTQEVIEKEYEHYAKNLKQQIFIGKISKDNDININEEDVKNHIIDIYAAQFGFDPADKEKRNQIAAVADSVLQNKEEANKIYDQLFDEKIKEVFKSKLKLNKKEVSYDDFIKIVDEHHKKHHNHEHA